MRPQRYFHLLAGLLVCLAGCTANAPYRRVLPVTSPSNTNRPANLEPIDVARAQTVETNGNCVIGYVEFDDQGWFWSHRQWQAVKDAIEDTAAHSPSGLTIVVFVHGWKSNADYDDPNVKLFRGVLSELSSNLNPRAVFGVYASWRGLSATSDLVPPLAKELSFYNRKDVAERIGHQGAATQVFTELEIMQDELNALTNRPDFHRTELIIVGHSFGGHLVYSAVSQVLEERLLLATRHKTKEPIRSLGDLVILLNPAFEASLYNNLISLATSTDIDYPTNQPPVLAIFTSKSDQATGLAFPVGRFFTTWFDATRPSKGPEEQWLFNVKKRDTPDERRAIRDTVGHDPDYISYDLNYVSLGTNAPARPKTSARHERNRRVQSLQRRLAENNLATDPTQLQPYVFTNTVENTTYACVLQPRRGGYAFKRGNPFLNVAVDEQIMNGHSDIANPVILGFLRDFILFTTQTNSPSADAE
ncbi:MAG TPA: hypothetical protein VMV72_01730 [Verrucomicrobiae bacterium]|nr:hypothetical protein [Verrucomicrobiae bacterium]